MDRVLHLKKNVKLIIELVFYRSFCWFWFKMLQKFSLSYQKVIYCLQFKDQVVREVVDKMCSEFSGQCCTHRALDPPAEEPSTSGTQKATSSTTLRASSSTPNCSSCKGPATGGGYQCRWDCPKTCFKEYLLLHTLWETESQDVFIIYSFSRCFNQTWLTNSGIQQKINLKLPIWEYNINQNGTS